MLETIFNKGGIVVHYDPDTCEAYTTDRGRLPVEPITRDDRGFDRFVVEPIEARP